MKLPIAIPIAAQAKAHPRGQHRPREARSEQRAGRRQPREDELVGPSLEVTQQGRRDERRHHEGPDETEVAEHPDHDERRVPIDGADSATELEGVGDRRDEAHRREHRGRAPIERLPQLVSEFEGGQVSEHAPTSPGDTR